MNGFISETKAYVACKYYPKIGKNFVSFPVLCLSSILGCIRGLLCVCYTSFFNTYFGSAWITQCIWLHYGKKSPKFCTPQKLYTNLCRYSSPNQLADTLSTLSMIAFPFSSSQSVYLDTQATEFFQHKGWRHSVLSIYILANCFLPKHFKNSFLHCHNRNRQWHRNQHFVSEKQ